MGGTRTFRDVPSTIPTLNVASLGTVGGSDGTVQEAHAGPLWAAFRVLPGAREASLPPCPKGVAVLPSLVAESCQQVFATLALLHHCSVVYPNTKIHQLFHGKKHIYLAYHTHPGQGVP